MSKQVRRDVAEDAGGLTTRSRRHEGCRKGGMVAEETESGGRKSGNQEAGVGKGELISCIGFIGRNAT